MFRRAMSRSRRFSISRRFDDRRRRFAIEPLEDRRLLAVSSFQDGVFPTPNYDGARDAPVFGAEPDTNFGGESTLRADAVQGATGLAVWSLLKWDVSHIPPGAVVNDVSIRVNVTNTSEAPGFHLFEMKTPWTESEVTWNVPTSTGSWEEPGLTDPVDVGSTKLGTLVGATIGNLEVSLNSDGRAVVQGWIDDPSKNQGFLLANVENGNSLRFDSREAAIADNRPRLTIDTSEAVPPTAVIVKPRDGGEADQDARSGEVLVGIRNQFQIRIVDFELDLSTVTADTVTITRDGAALFDYAFSFDAESSVIALVPTAASFTDGRYLITLNGGAAKISDTSGNQMPATVLAIEIDEGLPTYPIAAGDRYETKEDTPLQVGAATGLLANDFDGNDRVEALIGEVPSHGSVELNRDGSFTYTPDSGFFGSDEFTYRSVTPLFTSPPATVHLTVLRQSPSVLADAYQTSEDTTLSIDSTTGVLANDLDPQGDSLTAILVDAPEHGTLVLNPNGSFTYGPEADFFGIDRFAYRASDGSFDSRVGNVTINVNAVNDAFDDFYTVGQDRQRLVDAAGGVVTNDSLSEGNLLSAIRLSAPEHGELQFGPDGSFLYSPDDGFSGQDVFRYGLLNRNVELLDVDDEIRLRGFRDDAFGRVVAVSGNTLIVSADEDDEPAVSSGAVYVYEWEHDQWQSPAKLKASDSRFRGRFGVDVAIDGDRIVVGAPFDDSPRDSGSAYVFERINGSWIETAKLRAPSPQGNAFFGMAVAVNGDRIVVGAPNENAPLEDSGAVYVFDKDGSQWRMTVKLVPDDAAKDDLFGSEVVVFEDVIVVGSPGDDDLHGFSGSAYVFHERETGWVQQTKLLPNDRDNFFFGGALAIDNEFIVVGDSWPGFGVSIVGTAYVYARREDAWSLHTKLHPPAEAGPRQFFGGSVAIEGNTIVIGSPLAERNGVETGIVSIFQLDNSTWTHRTDLAAGTGGRRQEFGGTAAIWGQHVVVGAVGTGSVHAYPMQLTDVATVHVDVTSEPNDEPLAEEDSYEAVEDTTLRISADLGLLANDVDPEGETLDAVLDEPPRYGSLTLSADGSFTYLPDADFFGADEFSYRANDAGGSSAPTRVTIDVAPINDAPVAGDDAYEVKEGGTLIVDTAQLPSLGPRIFQSTTRRTVGMFGGNTIFERQTFAARFRVINPVLTARVGGEIWNHPQRGEGLVEGDGKIYAAIVALSGPADFPDSIDISTPDVVGHTIITLPGSGSSSLAWGELTVNLLPGWYAVVFGSGRFGAGGQGTTSQRGIGPFNILYGTPSDGWINQLDAREHFFVDSHRAPPGVLANDTDVEGDFLQARVVQNPQHGLITFNPDGTFVYTPRAGFVGTDQFTYQATDGFAESNLATVTINVTSSSRIADLTGDGRVDFRDLTLLLANWNQEVTASQGNLVAPTTTPVNFQDLTLLLSQWTGPAAAGASPQRLAVTETRAAADGGGTEIRVHLRATDRNLAGAADELFDRLGGVVSPLERRLSRPTNSDSRRTQRRIVSSTPLRRFQSVAVDRAMQVELDNFIGRPRPGRRSRPNLIAV